MSKVSFKQSFVGQLTGVEYTDGLGQRTLSGIVGSLAHPVLGALATFAVRSMVKPGAPGLIKLAAAKGGAK